MDGQGLRAEPCCACLPLERVTEGQEGLGQELWEGISTKREYFQECQNPSFWLQIEEGQLYPRGRGNLYRVGFAESPPHLLPMQPGWLAWSWDPALGCATSPGDKSLSLPGCPKTNLALVSSWGRGLLR